MRRRIAMISEHASPLADPGSVDSGGQNIYVAHVARNLAKAGHHVDVFTRRDDEALAEIYDCEDGVRVIHVPAGPPEFVRKEELLGHMKSFTDYLIAFFKEQEAPYDLMHANFWMSGLVAADIKRALGTPFVITFHALGRVRRQHQGDNDEFPDQRFKIEDRIVREADGIIAECPQDERDLVCLYQADPARIRLVPCGFDPHELWPVDKGCARDKIGIAQDEWMVLQLGRLVPRKGVDTAIRGFARFVKENDVPARMVIVGGASVEPDPKLTPEIGRLQKIAAEEQVSDRVLFAGCRGRDDIKYYFSAADVFISTPWYEPFGITPVESMACGTPVIGARVGGIKYTILDGETGFLVPPNDPAAVGRRLAELHKDRKKHARLSQQAIKRVNEIFTWEKVANQLADFYEDVLSRVEILGDISLERPSNGRVTKDHILLVMKAFEEALLAFERSQEVLGEAIPQAAETLITCLERGGKVMVCGNGGSAADGQHFAAELVGRFVSTNRKGLPILALTAETAFLTAWSNDIGYENIFARQVEAFGKPGDVLIGISTSGRSKNVLEAFRVAREMGIECISLLGGDGGEMLPLSDAALIVPSTNTQRIQEVQMLVLHLLCELVEKQLRPGYQAAIEPLSDVLAEKRSSSWELQSLIPVHIRRSRYRD